MKKNHFFSLLIISFFMFFGLFSLTSCGDTKKECNHIYEIIDRKDPTCVDDGYIKYKCSKCGDTYQDIIESNSDLHQYGEFIIDKPATCTESGIKHCTCKFCNNSITEKIPALGHDYVFGVCSRCGNVAEETIDGIVYSIKQTTNGNYAFVKCASDKGITSIEILEEFLNLPVLEIGDNAFEGCNKLSSIKFSKTITSIGYKAFLNCTNLNKVILPTDYSDFRCKDDSFEGVNNFNVDLEKIKSTSSEVDKVFGKNNSLIDKVTIKSGKIIPSEFFAWNYYKEIDLPDSIEEIGEGAFMYSHSLTKLIIPNSVKKIGESILYECNKLSYLEFPIIDNGQNFYKTFNRWPDNIVINGGTNIPNNYFEGAIYKSFTIPETISKIGKEAFKNCKSLENIEIGENIIYIGDSAFINCTSLVSMVLKNPNIEVFGNAFLGCTNIDTIEFSLNNINKNFIDTFGIYPDNVIIRSGTNIPDSFFKDSKTKNIVLSEGILSISNNAFKGCNNLDKIVLPKGLLSIGDNAFNSCINLNNIELQEGLTTIGNNAFKGCNNLNKIVLPKGLLSIGDNAFNSCINLKKIELPEGLTTIGNNAFNGCLNLTNVEIPKGMTILKNGTFKNCTNLSNIIIPESIKRIEEYCFHSCSNLQKIELPSELEFIGEHSFEECIKLTGIFIPKSVMNIEYLAFNSIPKFTICCEYNEQPSSWNADWNACYISYNKKYYKTIWNCREIGTTHEGLEWALFNNNNLAVIGYKGNNDSIIVPKIINNHHVKEISPRAFEYCDILKSIEILSDIEAIKNSTFIGCSNLTNVKLPSSIIKIDDYAFANCENLYNFIMPNNVENIGISLFENCTNLSDVKLSNKLTGIPTRTFYDCSSLSNLEISRKVTYIGEYAFYRCIELKIIDLPNSLTTIEQRAFTESGFDDLVIKSSISKIDQDAFLGCYATIYLEDETNTNNLKFSGTVVYNYGGKHDFTPDGFKWALTNNKEITIVKYIGENEDMIIPSIIDGLPVTTIANDAFIYSDIKFVTIPKSVKTLSKNAISNQKISAIFCEVDKKPDGYDFYQFNQYSPIVYNYGGKHGITYNGFKWALTKDNDISFYNKYYYEKYDSDGIMTIPESIGDYKVTRIAENACRENSWLNEVIIPNTVTDIGDNAFSGCVNINCLNLSYKLEHIGKNAFSSNPSLSNMSIPNSVLTIGDNAFSNCNFNTTLFIPKNVQKIGDGAFTGSYDLNIIRVDSLNKFYDSRNGCNALIETATNKLICGCTSTIIPKDILKVGNKAFYGKYTLTDITIPEGVISIGDSAFERCYKLEKIDVPNTVNFIGKYAFYHCDLISINIPYGVTSIGRNTFEACKLTSVKIPNTVTSIGSEAFYNCYNLEKVSIPKSVTEMGNGVFCTYYDKEIPCTIYCESSEKPEKWSNAWCQADYDVKWGAIL